MTPNALLAIRYFFDYGYWKNPYLAGTELEIFGENYTSQSANILVSLNILFRKLKMTINLRMMIGHEELDELKQIESQEEREYEELLFEKEMERKERFYNFE